MKQEQEPYAGTGILEHLAEAVNYNAYLVSLIKSRLSGTEQVIDFGAGIGTFAEPLAESCQKLICVEPDAEQAMRLASLGLTYFHDLGPIADDSQDLVYSLNVLEHIEDDAAVFSALCDRLKPGGTLLIYVPAFMVLYSTFDAEIGHVRRYRLEQLTRLAETNNLRIEEGRYVDSLGFLAALAFKLLRLNSGGVGQASVRIYDSLIFPASLWLDKIVGKFFGKNVLLIAHKKA